MKERIDEIFDIQRFRFNNIQASGKDLEDSLKRTLGILYRAVRGGQQRWIITYSGGKDSTTLCVVACEIVRRRLSWAPESVDIIYADTLQEIPAMHDAALNFLNFVRNSGEEEEDLPIFCHVTRPIPQQTFWFLILGKGYPAPHRRFWWCTERLKVNPVKAKMAELNHRGDTAVLTGVRFGESPRRDQQMNKAAQCQGQGECGQVLEYHGALAPIAHWKTCQIWDLLAFYAPSWGWPTQTLVDLYGDSPIRFGCWSCTLLDHDRAMDAVIQRTGQKDLIALSQFREFLKQKTSAPESRLVKPNGQRGKLTLNIRVELLAKVRELEKQVNMQLLTLDQEQQIREYWATEQ